jgi:hypothetical protein
MITANNPANDLYEYESEIIQMRDELFWELQTTGSVIINHHEVTSFDLLEEVSDDDKADVFSMLLTGNEDVKSHAIDLLMHSFVSNYDDEAILKHYSDKMLEWSEM